MLKALLLCLLLLFSAHFLFAQQQSYSLNILLGNVIQEGQDIALDSDGNAYVADIYSVVSFFPDGRLRKEYTLARKDYLWNTHNGIALDQENNLYILSSYNGTISKLNNAGELLNAFGGKGSKPGEFLNPNGIAVDSSGNIYIADTGNNRIQKFDNAGNFLLEFGAEGTEEGLFRAPIKLATDRAGNVFVADRYNGRIQKFDPEGAFLKTYTILKDPPTHIGTFDVALDTDDAVYATDYENFRILKFNPDGEVSKVIDFTNNFTDHRFEASSARIAVDKSGYIYLSELVSMNNSDSASRFQKLNAEGEFIYSLGRLGKGQYSLEAGYEIAVDAVGNFYVCNYNTRTISRHNRFGSKISEFGGEGSGNDKFNRGIADISLDTHGNLYVFSEKPNGYIQKFDRKGDFISTLAPLEPDVIIRPTSIQHDKQGNLYLIDERAIHKYDATGNRVSSITLTDPKTGRNIEFYNQIAFDKQNNIYLLDNYAVKKYDPSGNFLSQFGSYGTEPDKLKIPTSLALDDAGYIYVIDNSGIKKFSPDGILHSIIIEKSRRISMYSSKIDVSPDGNRIYVSSRDLSDNSIMIYASDEANNAVLNTITGIVYDDLNSNCTKEATEKGLANIIIEATPGPYYGITDEFGYYSITVDSGVYQVSQLLPKDIGRTITPVCSPTLTGSDPIVFDGLGQVASDQDFGNQVMPFPSLSVSVASDRRRRCFRSTTRLTYSNAGFAPSENTYVYLQLPDEVKLISADSPYTSVSNGTYVFDAGTLAVGETRTITIQDSVVCGDESIRGLTVCTKTWISTGEPTIPAKALTTVSGNCNYGTGQVRFVIRNAGQAAMEQLEQYRIYQNAELATVESYRLAGGDSLVLLIPAFGNTLRLEADQPEGNGDNTVASTTVEACREIATRTAFSTGFVNTMPPDDEEAEVAGECLPIIDSYDPNDKLVTPTGVTEQNYTPTNTALSYKIRFQNTGTDVAYRVVVVDTLSEHLDLSTLQLGAASHHYTYELSGKGRPVLTWTFHNIMLPDSSTNEPGSHGYIQFSIRPTADLPEKTIVENFADIFFDYNSPIRTNVTANSIYDMPLEILEENRINADEVIMSPSLVSFSPAAGKFGTTVEISGLKFSEAAGRNKLYFNGVLAEVVAGTTNSLRVKVPAGSSTGTLKVITEHGSASSASIFTVYQPPVVTSFSPIEGVEGSEVTLTGNYLSPDILQSIQLGSLSCEIISSTQGTVTVKVPAGASTGEFTVISKGGTVKSSTAYQVWHTPAIFSFDKTMQRVGGTVMLRGENFAPALQRNILLFGSIQAEVLQANEQMLEVRVPAGASTGPVTVTTPGGTATSTFEVIPAPLITEVYPAKASVGAVVELKGTYFLTLGKQDTVTFEGVEAFVVAASTTSLKVRVPRGASSGNVKVAGPGGQAEANFEVEQLTPDQAIQVYPNPSSGKFTLDFIRADFDVKVVQVFDATARLIYEQQLQVGQQGQFKAEVDLSEKKPGIYHLVIQTERGSVVKRLSLL